MSGVITFVRSYPGQVVDAIRAAAAGLSLLTADRIDNNNVVFAITDALGRRGWIEMGPDGKPTPEAAALIADTVASAVGNSIGVESDSSAVLSDVVFAVVDEAGRRGWIEMTAAGTPTPEAAAIIAAAVAPGIGVNIGLETGAAAAASDVAFAVLDTDGRVSDLAIDAAGKFSQATVDRLATRLGVGPASVGFDQLTVEVSSRLLTIYVPEVSGGNLYANRQPDGGRVLISSGGNPRNTTTTVDGYVLWTDDTGTWARDGEATGPIIPQVGTEWAYACWGESTTFGTAPNGYTNTTSYPEQMALVLGHSVYNGGYPGRASTEIAVEQGGIQLAVTVTANTIPASGPVTVTSWAPPTSWRTDASNVTTYPGTLAGVPGNLVFTEATDTMTFTRTSPGSPVACPPGTPYVSTTGDAHRNEVQIIWTGRNNVQAGTTLNDVARDIAAMVAHLRPYTKRYLVSGPIPKWSEAGASPVIDLNAGLADTYGDRYVDLHHIVVDNALDWLTGAGITPTADDISKVASGVMPASLSPDGIHLLDLGYTKIGQTYAAAIQAKGWV